MKHVHSYTFLLLVLFLSLTSCEKVIDIKLADGENLPYADAWITDQPGQQQIKLYKAVNYFAATAPEPITDAEVKVTDLTSSQTYTFTYSNGAYVYNPGNNQRIGFVDHNYRLSITYKGEQYEAFDQLNRTVPIDSITYEPEKAMTRDGKDGFEAEFHAKDAAGKTDYYWIRTYLDGKRNKGVPEMVSIDGSFYENLSDGYRFITPFTKGINDFERLYQKGDKVKVVLRSLSRDSYEFIKQAAFQLYDGGLFQKVPENVKSNIRNTNAQSKNKLIGWFGTTAESSLEVEIK